MSTQEIIDLSMIDVRYLKTFNSEYGAETELAERLMDAQAQCFLYEGRGVQVSEKLVTQLVGDPNGKYPILGAGTTKEDYEEAMGATRQES